VCPLGLDPLDCCCVVVVRQGLARIQAANPGKCGHFVFQEPGCIKKQILAKSRSVVRSSAASAHPHFFITGTPFFVPGPLSRFEFPPQYICKLQNKTNSLKFSATNVLQPPGHQPLPTVSARCPLLPFPLGQRHPLPNPSPSRDRGLRESAFFLPWALGVQFEKRNHESVRFTMKSVLQLRLPARRPHARACSLYTNCSRTMTALINMPSSALDLADALCHIEIMTVVPGSPLNFSCGL